jgi:hypothetical protein
MGLLLFPILLLLAAAYWLCLWSVRPDALVQSIDDGPEARARRALD